MKKYFMKRYALSETGANDLIKASILLTFLNIAQMLPMIFGFMFLQQYLSKLLGLNSPINLSLLQYILFAILFFVIQFMFARISYGATYTKVYDESSLRRINLAEKLRKLPLSYFSKKDISDLSATIMSDATLHETLFSHSIPQIYAAFCSTIVIFIMLSSYNIKMTLALFWVLPVAFIIFGLSFKAQKRADKNSFDKDRIVIDTMQEGIDLVSELKLYNKENEYLNKFNKQIDDVEKAKIRLELTAGVSLNFAYMILKLGLGSVIVYGAYLLLNGRIDTFTYFIYLIISASIYNPITDLLNHLAELLFLDNIAQRMNEIENMPMQKGSDKLNTNKYDIEFKDVKFSYEDGVRVLDGISFTAKQGEVTALVGPSGGGKSTTARCAARFWDIDSGTIILGGVDISKVEPEQLLKAYSVVFQNVTLFNGSILENIRLGKKDASDEEVMKVAKLAQCDEFISELPDGIMTEIGENGAKLSGGERQRISIARAMLKDAQVILLDEATASLDAENESKVQRALSELVRNKTVIVIAHRMRTIIEADNIIVLANGKIQEQGNAKELLANKGMFFRMHQSQLRSI